jgi:hypothetical protein
MAGKNNRAGGGRGSGGSSVAAGRKAKDRYKVQTSRARYKSGQNSSMPYQGPKRVKGSF